MKTIAEIIEALPEEDREETQSFLDRLETEANVLKSIDSKEKAEEFIINTDVFKRAFDSKVSKAVDTYKVENFDVKLLEGIQKGVKDELAKLADKSKKTPEQIKIEELEKQVNAGKLKGEMQDRRDLTILELSNRGLDIKAANLLVADNDEKTRLNIDIYESLVNPFKTEIEDLQKKLKVKHAQTGTPEDGNKFSNIKNPFKFDKAGNPGFDMDMQNKLFKENPTLYNQFLNEHRGTKN